MEATLMKDGREESRWKYGKARELKEEVIIIKIKDGKEE